MRKLNRLHSAWKLKEKCLIEKNKINKKSYYSSKRLNAHQITKLRMSENIAYFYKLRRRNAIHHQKKSISKPEKKRKTHTFTRFN